VADWKGIDAKWRKEYLKGSLLLEIIKLKKNLIGKGKDFLYKY